jgi:hypothetical protein
MGSWADCSIWTHQPQGRLTCRCPTIVKNLPLSVRTTDILGILRHAINMSCWLVIHDLYPDHEVDAELSDEDNNG